MPGPFVDVVAVASPTTAATPFKDLPGVVPVREGRSQSLTALPRRASTASVLTVESSASVFQLQQDQQQHARQTRRALSSATSTSLSLLQEELGYPRRAQVSAYDGPRCDRRRSSVVDTSSDVVQNDDDDRRPLARRQQSNTSHYNNYNNYNINSSSSGSTGCALSSRTLFSSSDDDGASLSFHGRSSSLDHDRDGGDEDENFMNYRRASVTGYSRDTDGVVYYEVIVKSLAHGPLSAYKVRRRYSEFRALHVALRGVMAVSAVTALARIRDDSSKSQEEEEEEKEKEEEEQSKTRRGATSRDGRDKEPTLPPLPDKGGVWSYLQFDSIPLLERRAKYFHAMLAAAQRHPRARASRLLNDFVGTPPDLVSLYSSVENSYVSLNRFAAPKLSFAIEIQERKEKAKSIRRRRNSLHRQSFTGSLDASFLSSCPSQ
uniref:PX domain-containing protein n=1 Tax=Hyaloperonospora arabidopsidis (strain Emoy2) TaxID=559515 RepID=M4BS10_HYAAE